MGADRVIYGSDWPHMEGMEHPRDILEELDGVSLADQEKILHRNTAALNSALLAQPSARASIATREAALDPLDLRGIEPRL